RPAPRGLRELAFFFARDYTVLEHMDVAKERFCPDCGGDRPITSFYVTKVVKERTYYSRYCQLHHGLRVREHERRRQADNYILLWTWFVDHPCVDCGETNPLKLQ